MNSPEGVDQTSERYRRRVLGLLILVYTLNFIDRQIISVLASDIKRDLGLTDADLGFLYGTAFGVFYAVFGVAMGRLADGWNRVRMISLGLSLWSMMTALSGLSRTAFQLAAARIGVGVGEATASPCAYSLISDYYPRERRATALGLYATGTYLGTGVSLFLGAVILQSWNRAFPDGWHGLVGWQVAFFLVGLPGLVLALFVSRLREPIRGELDGLPTPPAAHPFRDFAEEFVSVVPPFTLIGAMRASSSVLATNLGAAVLLAAAAFAIGRGTGNMLQWGAVGIGFYAVFSWATTLRRRDPPAFRLIWGTPAFMLVVLSFGLSAALNYAVAFWGLPYAETMLGADKATAGLLIGGGSAAGGFLGLTIGGKLADRLRATNPAGRVIVILIGFVAPVIPILIAFTTGDRTLFCLMYFPFAFLSSLGQGAVSATTQDLVLPRMRGQATATLFISINMIGLAFGPYAVGRIAASTGNIGSALLVLLVVAPISAVLALILYRMLPRAEATLVDRARAAGEPV